MTLFTKLFVFGFAIVSLASCGNKNTPTPNPNSQTRSSMISVKFQGKEISINSMNDIITVSKKRADAEQDAAIVANLFGNLNTAKNQQALEVNFSASDEAVTNGMFIFSIQSDEQKSLGMKMYDEEGFELANNTIDLTGGQNYKALNVSELNSGEYAFRLVDNEGKELNRKITVKN